MIAAFIRIVGVLAQHVEPVIAEHILERLAGPFVALQAVMGPGVGYPVAVLFQGGCVIDRGLPGHLVAIVEIPFHGLAQPRGGT